MEQGQITTIMASSLTYTSFNENTFSGFLLHSIIEINPTLCEERVHHPNVFCKNPQMCRSITGIQRGIKNNKCPESYSS